MFAHLHVHLDMLNIYFYYDMRTDVSKESLIALLCNLNEMWFQYFTSAISILKWCFHAITSDSFSFDLFGTVLHCEQDSSTGKLSWSSSLQRYGNSLCSLHKSPLDLGWVSLVKSHKWRLKCTFLDRVISCGHGGNVDVSALLSSKNVNRYFTCCQMGLTPLAHWRAVAAASGSQVL